VNTTTWVFAFLLLSAASGVHAETRVALVIGNGAYLHMHDATDVAASLQKLHYSVQLLTDSTKAGMQAALVQFARSAVGAGLPPAIPASYGAALR
jgi:hypothetical protein